MTSVKDWSALNDSSPVENLKSQYLCFGLMAVGVGSITESTWNDAWVRLEIYQKVNGAIISDGEGNGLFWTPEDIHRRIGYQTNVGNVPWTQFIKNLRTNLQFDAGKKIIRQELLKA
jgi:hypothetical protein